MRTRTDRVLGAISGPVLCPAKAPQWQKAMIVLYIIPHGVAHCKAPVCFARLLKRQGIYLCTHDTFWWANQKDWTVFLLWAANKQGAKAEKLMWPLLRCKVRCSEQSLRWGITVSLSLRDYWWEGVRRTVGRSEETNRRGLVEFDLPRFAKSLSRICYCV